MHRVADDFGQNPFHLCRTSGADCCGITCLDCGTFFGDWLVGTDGWQDESERGILIGIFHDPHRQEGSGSRVESRG